MKERPKPVINCIMTSPSLREEDNVSGIASVVSEILALFKDGKEIRFKHLGVGAKDRGRSLIQRLNNSFSSARELAMLLPESDIIHINTAMNPKAIFRDYYLAMLCHNKKPLIVHIHGGKYIDRAPNNVLLYLVRGLIHFSNRVILLSERERSMFTSVYGQEAQDRISILHNFVSPVDEKMLSRTLPESGANQKLKVVFVGRLEHEKGLAIIVDALSKAHHLCTTLEMDVYGGGSLGNWFCRRMAEQLGSNFRYNGVVPRSQIRQSLSQYDVILLPSLFGEGLPMAMLEAMSAGCVPFVSALASVPLVVQDGVTGVLLQPGSSDDLADKLAWAVHNPQKLLQISDSAAMHVRNNYSPLDFKRSLLAIYASELPGALPGSIKTNGGRAGNRN